MNYSSKAKALFNHFPTPEYLSLSNSGIAISDDSLKFIEFHHGLFGRGLTLERFSRLELPPGVIQGGDLMDADSLTRSLAVISNKYGITYTRATLPEEKAYLFSTSIARVPVEGLKDAVAFIIEENAPVSLADSVFDFDIVESSPGSAQLKVTVSVLPKKIVEAYMAAFQAAGMIPVSFDIESQAMARAIIPTGEHKSQMIVNLEAKKTGFYVFDEGAVQFTTTLPYGTESDNVEELQTEMNKIFVFWNARNKKVEEEGRIENALVSGGGALNQVFVEKLMKECPVPYSWANPWVNIAHGGGKPPKKLGNEVFSYASAIGLALPHPHRPYV